MQNECVTWDELESESRLLDFGIDSFAEVVEASDSPAGVHIHLGSLNFDERFETRTATLRRTMTLTPDDAKHLIDLIDRALWRWRFMRLQRRIDALKHWLR